MKREAVLRGSALVLTPCIGPFMAGARNWLLFVYISGGAAHVYGGATSASPCLAL